MNNKLSGQQRLVLMYQLDSNYTILLQDFYCRNSKIDPNKLYDIWVHGLGMTKVYFQIGMIIGDTEVHNKICGFRGGNGLYRLYVCRDCLVSFEDADNPNIGCESCKVSDD